MDEQAAASDMFISLMYIYRTCGSEIETEKNWVHFLITTKRTSIGYYVFPKPTRVRNVGWGRRGKGDSIRSVPVLNLCFLLNFEKYDKF